MPTIPKGSAYFENHGCPFNKFDLEVIMRYLKDSRYVVVKDLESADILVLNTCGVKKATEDKILSRIISLRKLNKSIVITG